MIEANRKLYLDESSALKNENFNKIKTITRNMLQSLQQGF